MRHGFRIVAALLCACLGTVSRTAAQDAVPPLVQIGGDLNDGKGRALTGPQTVTFALYKEQSGDAPLWAEVQAVTADARGHFIALLGATSPGGLPLDLFSMGQGFAAGLNAKANHNGTFVWSDASAGSFASTAANQFLIRATGGVGVNTATPIAMLDVRGDLDLQDATNNGVVRFPSAGGLFFRDNGNNLDRMFVSGSTGYVGIGTHSPTQMLDVAGSVNLTGDVTATGNVSGRELCIGFDCRIVWPTGGSDSVPSATAGHIELFAITDDFRVTHWSVGPATTVEQLPASAVAF